jgi:uncharacterized protein YbjT (DUF2867 family)
MTARSALLLGASGLVGRSCLELLLRESRYTAVHVVARSQLPQQHDRLRQHVIDFAALADTVAGIAAADVYCCLGTTIKKAGSQEAFRRVDYEYPLLAAQGAARSGGQQFLIVTALGADAGSRIFYNRVKGEVERDISALPLPTVHILRPSLLLGERDERRAAERVSKVVMAALGPLMIGGARKYRAIAGETVARAMVELAKQDRPGRHIHESDALQQLGGVA